ncbi:hypothetical protein GQ54DRAFT_267157 [Martensiomyces pterosporus]|nr:hypothetical protein GQ54DRAFT_267157 [Martensiomyces pterosporus]
MHAAIKALLLIAALAGSKRVVHDWEITYVTSNRGLDQAPKRGYGVNGKFPLPIVDATIGDTLVINVRNSLDVPTSLHAHGISQRGTNYYDGVAMTTECSIAPGTNFTYEIPLQQAGTFWIHGHTSEQNFDGLRTPLIIHDTHELYRYDKELVFAVEDWSPLTIQESLGEMHQPGILILPLKPPPHMLINGIPGNKTLPVYFTPGITYRIRLLCMMSMPNIEFVVDDHDLTLIEVDGVYTKPKTLKVLRLSPGQRASVLVAAKKATQYNFSYRINTGAEFFPNLPGYYPANFNGTVVYSTDAPLFTPNEIPSGPLDELDIESLPEQPLLTPDRSIFFNVTYGFAPDTFAHDTINLITYAEPRVPSMFSALTTGDMAINPIIYGPQTNAHVLKYGEVIEVVLWSATFVTHPFHLHGHTFQIVEKGFVNDTTGALRYKVPQSKHSPLRRDTVVVRRWEYVIIRFKADNPGVWLFHCHFDVHMGLGMALVFVEAPQMMQKTLSVPQPVIDQCKLQGKQVHGNVVGEMSYDYADAPNAMHLLPNPPGK